MQNWVDQEDSPLHAESDPPSLLTWNRAHWKKDKFKYEGYSDLSGPRYDTAYHETMECNGIDGVGCLAPKSDDSLVPLSIGTSWLTETTPAR
ncbi:hypothetical protein HAX54_024281 [Datura stramonium]|uniref:Uncharacterized protein n=1 Tax=Datura stramonium TaxID=4076 RepID=A0ABS8UY17_DATST|nr:hypothetical protein [Datura stramonium]